MHDYREAVIASNLLPPLYLKVLKDLLLFSKIMSGNYDVDFSIFYEINWSAYRMSQATRNSLQSSETQLLVQNRIQSECLATKKPSFFENN